MRIEDVDEQEDPVGLPLDPVRDLAGEQRREGEAHVVLELLEATAEAERARDEGVIADEARRVEAGFAQDLRERARPLAHRPRRRLPTGHPRGAVEGRPEAGEHRGMRGHGPGAGRSGPVVDDGVTREALDRGGRQAVVAVGRQVVGAQRVHDDEDDVAGYGNLRTSLPTRGERCQNKGQEAAAAHEGEARDSGPSAAPRGGGFAWVHRSSALARADASMRSVAAATGFLGDDADGCLPRGPLNARSRRRRAGRSRAHPTGRCRATECRAPPPGEPRSGTAATPRRERPSRGRASTSR